MVYLDVYNSIFEYLEEIEIVDDVFEYAEEIINPMFDKIKSNEMMNDMVAELALFNYMHNDQLLIDFLSEKLYPKLNQDEKEEFDSIKNSNRCNLKFNKKEKLNQLDTKGKELYDFHFYDVDNDEPKTIVSSTALDELKHNLNARLIKNPIQKGKFSIIGGIFNKETSEAVSSLCEIKQTMERFEEIKSHIGNILEFSKKHSLAEIGNYKNEKSSFLEQDKEIMKINRLFFEKFNIGFDDFLMDFLELSNNPEKFTEMAEYYLSVVDELKEAILATNYSFPSSLLLEKSLIKGFAAFIKKDKTAIKESIDELKERGKQEFENGLITEKSLSRENIIKNSKRFLSEKVAPLKLKGFDSFIKKLDSYSPEHIKEFLLDIVGYLEKLPEDANGFEIPFFTAMSKDLLEKAEEIPYLNEASEKQKHYKYIPEEFYEYIDADEEAYDLFIFLSAADHICNQRIKEAYELLKENKMIRTKSFDMMFLIGKIFGFFDNKEYRKYFNEAKRIDKERYKNELKSFLGEKEQKKLSL